MKLKPEVVPVLIVALITWGGVLLYLLRVELLAKRVQDEVERRLDNKE